MVDLVVTDDTPDGSAPPLAIRDRFSSRDGVCVVCGLTAPGCQCASLPMAVPMYGSAVWRD
jgi:hypothetical protein